jgi:hypothetical protein
LFLSDRTGQCFNEQLHGHVLRQFGVVEVGIDLDNIRANQLG